MKKKHYIHSAVYSLLMVFVLLSACQNSEAETSETIYDDTEIIIDNDSENNTKIIVKDDNEDGTNVDNSSESYEYIERIKEEMTDKDFIVVELPGGSLGKMYESCLYSCNWVGEGEEMSCVITRTNLENPEDYYQFDTKKMVDTKGIFPSNNKEIEYFVGYNETIEKWVIDIEDGTTRIKDECTVEDITTSQANLLDVYKDNNYYYFYYVLWGDEYTDDGRAIYKYRLYVKDDVLDSVYYEDIPVCDNLTNKLFLDDERNLNYISCDEEGYFIQQVKSDETKICERRNVCNEWMPNEMWQVFLYQGNLWYISNGYIYKTNIDSGDTEKKYYLLSLGIEAEDFIYDWRIVDGVIEIIYQNKAIYVSAQ